MGDYYCGERKFWLLVSMDRNQFFESTVVYTNDAVKGNLPHLSNCQCFLVMICICTKVFFVANSAG